MRVFKPQITQMTRIISFGFSRTATDYADAMRGRIQTTDYADDTDYCHAAAKSEKSKENQWNSIVNAQPNNLLNLCNLWS